VALFYVHVAIGGQDKNTTLTNAIYEIDLSGETPEIRLLPNTLPTARADVAAGYDPVKGRLYIFGGREISQFCSIGDTEIICVLENNILGDFYFSDRLEDGSWSEWSNWEPTEGQAWPSARYGAALIPNSYTSRAVLFGGVQENEGNDDSGWVFDQNDGWTTGDFTEYGENDCRRNYANRDELGKMCRNRVDHWSNPIGQLQCGFSMYDELVCDASTDETSWVGSYLTIRNQNVVASGNGTNKVYIGTDWGLDVVYVGLDYAPIRLGWMPTNGPIVDLEVRQDYSYHLDDDGLNVFDLNWDILPIRVGQEPLVSGKGEALALAYPYVYAISTDALEVFDVSNPEQPINLGQFQLDADAKDIVVKGNFAYIGTSDGIVVVSVADPTSIRFVEFLETDVPVTKMRLGGEFIYCLCGDSLAYTARILAPGHLRTILPHNVEPWVRGILTLNNRMYWAKGHWMHIRKL
jgi:hypothetical protein